jgi:hypothetical protein
VLALAGFIETKSQFRTGVGLPASDGTELLKLALVGLPPIEQVDWNSPPGWRFPRKFVAMDGSNELQLGILADVTKMSTEPTVASPAVASRAVARNLDLPSSLFFPHSLPSPVRPLNEILNHFTFALLCRFEHSKLFRGQVPLDSIADDLAQLIGFDSVEFNADIGAESFGATVGGLCGARRQSPLPNLSRGYCQALEMNFGCRCHLAQGLLDLLTCIDTGGVEVAQVIDEGRYAALAYLLRGAVQEG